jgi:hypothetical protein
MTKFEIHNHAGRTVPTPVYEVSAKSHPPATQSESVASFLTGSFMAGPAREVVPFMRPQKCAFGVPGSRSGHPPVEVIVKLPHCRGRPDGQQFLRRSVATVVHCCNGAFRASARMTSVHGGSLGPMLSGQSGEKTPFCRECYLCCPHSAYPRLQPPAASLPRPAIRPLHTAQMLPPIHFRPA